VIIEMEIKNREIEEEYNGLMESIAPIFHNELGFRNSNRAKLKKAKKKANSGSVI
jgi:hypothetical protein